MNRDFGRPRNKAGRVWLIVAVAAATVFALALPADANTGHVYANQNCWGWWASVTLDTNVTPAHFVEVTSTIPGTTGIVDGHYNTIGNSGTTKIWQASGSTISSGTVTLTILNADRSLDSTASATLPAAGNCTTTTTSTTLAPSTTTTAPPTTTTTAPPSTTTAPPTTLPPATTTPTTLAPTTTTAASAVVTTTTIAVSPVTEFSTTTTGPVSVGPQGSTVPPTTSAVTPLALTGTLPRTGSGTLYPLLFGGCLLAAGALLAQRRRRSSWNRS